MTHTTKHTPGPWALERDRAKSLSIYASSTFVGEVYNEVDEPSAQENANAHLIAAAPAMYEALQEIDDQLDQFTVKAQEELGLREALLKSRAALAQAEGKHD